MVGTGGVYQVETKLFASLLYYRFGRGRCRGQWASEIWEPRRFIGCSLVRNAPTPHCTFWIFSLARGYSHQDTEKFLRPPKESREFW